MVSSPARFEDASTINIVRKGFRAGGASPLRMDEQALGRRGNQALRVKANFLLAALSNFCRVGRKAIRAKGNRPTNRRGCRCLDLSNQKYDISLT